MGFNPGRKGQRSCWPLFATVAQTSQALDVLHRPGNVADSTGAREFMGETLARRHDALPGTRLEAHADSVFYGEDILDLFEERRRHQAGRARRLCVLGFGKCSWPSRPLHGAYPRERTHDRQPTPTGS